MSILSGRGYADVYAPRFFIEVDGSLAEDLAADTFYFEYSDSTTKNDELKIKVHNEGLKYIDDPRFREGAIFRIRFGYANDLSEMKVAKLVKAKPTFPSSGVPTLELSAFDLRMVMNKTAAPRNWGSVSSSDIAKKIAEKYELRTEVDESFDARKETRIQTANVTDIQFLQQLANKLNWDCYVDGQILYFKKKDYESPPTLEFRYFTDDRGTLIDFEPDVDLSKPAGVTMAAASPQTGASSETSGKGGTALGAYNVVNGNVSSKFGGTVNQDGFYEIASSSSETNKQVLQAHANALKSKIDLTAVKASAQVIGTPRVRSRKLVRFSGVGRTYSGNWRIESTTHTINATGQVYVTKMTLSRNALNLGTKKTDAAGGKNDKDPAFGTGGGKDEVGIEHKNTNSVYTSPPGWWGAK